MLLCFCAEGGMRPVVGWKSCGYLEGLAQKGLVEELPEPNTMFRHFKLTDTGRAKLAEMTRAENA